MPDIFGIFTGGAVEVVRPNDANAYAANDIVASLTATPIVDWAFPTIPRQAGGTGYVVKAKLFTNQAACVARFRLHLYTSAPTAIADNAQCTVLYANAGTWMGFIDFPACQQLGGTSDDCAQSEVVPGVTGKASVATLPLGVTADATKKIYGLLETLDAFTPAALQKFRIALELDAN